MSTYPLRVTVIVVAALATACSDDSRDPSIDAFYHPPTPLPSEVPGTLIRAEEIDPLAEGSRAWRVLYVSQALDGSPIAVSGLVAAPHGPAPAGGYEVVSWAHGLTGVTDRCTPSKGFRFGHDFYEVAPELVAAGYVGVATDYEGLGTPGRHPYLIGESEGRGVVDVVRAARNIDELDLGDEFVIWGLSQGGHAALFAGEIAASWAPELEMLGVISAAPGPSLTAAVGFGRTIPEARIILWWLTLSLDDVYPELSLDDVLSAEVQNLIERSLVEEDCIAEFDRIARDFGGSTFEVDPLTLPAWETRLEENSPGRVVTNAPILILQSEGDDLVPAVGTDSLIDTLCGAGAEVEYRTFEGLTHDDTTRQNVSLMLDWTALRFAGTDATTTCPRESQ